ncbi:MAG: cobalamin-dependent protein, partial [Planctomycetota bacterium]|nr:cobalamin-dependent protein [Planctomycetota bacterium]
FVDRLLDEHPPQRLLSTVVLPALEKIDRLDRQDQASVSALQVMSNAIHLAANRILGRLQGGLSDAERSLRVLLYCGIGDSEALQGEIMASLLEHDGHDVRFAGGGVPADEILEDVGRRDPDLLLLYASSASDGPGIRQVIDTIRDVDSRPDMQIVVAGGVFARAPGLAEEIGADLWTDDPEALRLAIVEEADRRAIPEQRTVGRTRRVSRAA